MKFLTGNRNKFTEAQRIIPSLQWATLDLQEIQELDPQKVIAAKLSEAALHFPGEHLIVEDVSLSFHGMGRLPGTLIKWFLNELTLQQLSHLAHSMGNTSAVARCELGYRHWSGNLKFFSAQIEGSIVEPRGNSGFGWDAIFVPQGESKTFAEMLPEQKDLFSMRAIAFSMLLEFTKSHR